MNHKKMTKIIDTETRLKGGYVNFILPDFMVFDDSFQVISKLDMLITLSYIENSYIYIAVSNAKISQFIIYDLDEWVKDKIYYIRQSIFIGNEKMAYEGFRNMFNNFGW